MKKIFLASILFSASFGFLFFNVSKAEAATLYYNAAVNWDWNTLGNWWTDPGCSLQALSLPTTSDDVIIDSRMLSNSGPAASVNTLMTYTYIEIPITVSNGAVFNNTGYINLVGSIIGRATFNVESINRGTVIGEAIFNGGSDNNGTVTGDATFNGNLSQNFGTVTGTKTRYYTADTTTVRNFVTDGPWTIVADGVGVVVDVTGATYDGSTIFSVLNGGSFLPEEVVLPNARVTSEVYVVSNVGGGSETIVDVPSGTTKATFLSNLTKGDVDQTWNVAGIHDPVVIGDTLVVTAEDEITTITYTVSLRSSDATVTSGTYTVSTVGDGEETITDVPAGTTKADFLAALTKGNANQTWVDTDISDTVVTGDTLVVTAEDETTTITYTVTVNFPDSTIFWFNSGVDADWTTLEGNWWTDEEHTIQAGALPGAEDAVGTVGTIGPEVDLDIWTSPASIDAAATGISFTSAEGVGNEINIIGDTIFDGNSYNTGTIDGIVTFYDSSANFGIITGNAIFNAASYNEEGTITGNATFNDLSYNSGIVSGDATFTYASAGTITLTASQYWGTVEGTARGVDGVELDNYIFNGEGGNAGAVVGNATFNDDSFNGGTVSGNAVFHNASYNDGGTISSNASFYNTSINYGTVEGNACFADDAYNNEDEGEGDLGVVNGDTTDCAVPTLTTSPATMLTQTGATLNGEMTDNGGEDATSRGFNWGLTSTYGTTVTQASGPYSIGTFSTALNGLTCGTTYHYRAFAINTSGITNGDDATFITSACDVPEEDTGSSGSSSGSSRSKISALLPNTVCRVGDKYSSTTGQPCTTFTSNTSQNSGPSVCLITMTLRQGYRGEQVKCLQTKLNILSDGIFGSMTKAAVISFQKLHNLVPDGIVGSKTRGAM